MRSSPLHHWFFQSDHREKFRDAYPKIPIIKSRKVIIEDSHSLQTRTSKYRTTTGNEVLFKQLPKDISLGTLAWIDSRRSLSLLVHAVRLTVDHSGMLVFLEQFDLTIDRTTQAQIVVVQKGYVFAFARQQSNVASACNALLAFDTHISDSRQLVGDAAGLITGGIIDNNHFNISSRLKRAFNRATEKL